MTFRTAFLNSFLDPIRRRNTLSRIFESLVGLTVCGLLLWGLDGWYKLLAYPAGVFAEYAIYEFCLEPLGLTGHYWERGPRDGEEFKIG